jgi:hypothetical protein
MGKSLFDMVFWSKQDIILNARPFL